MSYRRCAVPLALPALRAAYRAGALTPTALVDALIGPLAISDEHHVWITRESEDRLRTRARELERERDPALPLWGAPFAVKDNIDVAQIPTTAACRAFDRVPARSAPVIERLIAAGALYIGKTNLDQLATGLVGTRTPYGAPVHPVDPRYVPGGSSSGSAVAVATGLVSIALGTDTAGSGRVPAAFTGTVGLKPSRGLVSTRGVVPACRSLDCVSIFAGSVEDAVAAAAIIAGYDAEDPYARPDGVAVTWRPAAAPPRVRCGVPRDRDLAFFGDRQAEAAFARDRDRLRALGAELVEVDLTPFLAAGRLLYDGPWIAERHAALAPIVAAHPDAILPVTRAVIDRGAQVSGVDVFAGLHALAALRRQVDPLWAELDLLAVPSAPTHPRLDQVAARPIDLNAELGYYTTFVNLLDLAALAVPGGGRDDGLPAGITLIGPWGSDDRLAAIGRRFAEAQCREPFNPHATDTK